MCRFRDTNMGAPNCEFYSGGEGGRYGALRLANPGAAERLHRARAVWQQRSDIEAVDEDHLILILGSGGGARLPA